jgi:hypothetical protein
MKKQPMCAECRAGEIYDEPALYKVRFPNDRYSTPAPPITEWVCEGHLTMLTDDYGQECKVIEVYRVDHERHCVMKRPGGMYCTCGLEGPWDRLVNGRWVRA